MLRSGGRGRGEGVPRCNILQATISFTRSTEHNSLSLDVLIHAKIRRVKIKHSDPRVFLLKTGDVE